MKVPLLTNFGRLKLKAIGLICPVFDLTNIIDPFLLLYGPGFSGFSGSIAIFFVALFGS